MATEYLPDGTVIVTLGDELVWTPLDVFTWIAFRQRRSGTELASVKFPREQWSRDWRSWPTYGLASALREIATGRPWQPAPHSFEEEYAENDRAWARNIIERTRQDACELLDAVEKDLEHYRLADVDYQNAKKEVQGALRDGRLQVWARRAHGLAKPNHNAEPEPLPTRWFTHQPREVEEAGWVLGPGEYRGPWWDEARFDADRVVALWPAGAGIMACLPMPVPFPAGQYIAPWTAVSWRAFGTLDAPEHIAGHRSFDSGTDRLPDESDAVYADRQSEHRLFDGAERELMDLLASGRVAAIGKPPASKNGQFLRNAAARTHMAIPDITFQNKELAFDSCGGLMSRVSLLAREFDRQDLHGSDADPRFPLYYEVMLKIKELRKFWTTVEVSIDLDNTKIYSTGLAGRPSGRHFALQELHRRAQIGETETTLSAETKFLSAWFQREHPGERPLSPKALQNYLRREYRTLTQAPI